MRIFELTREAVAQPKPLPILPQGVQTPPPATGPGSAEYKQAMKYVSDLDQLGAVGNSPVSPAPTKPAPAANVAVKNVLEANVFVSYRAGTLPERM